jgi:hypothetical protein
MTEDLDLTAVSYALGLLRGDVRAAFAAEAERDPVLQARIDLWQLSLGALDHAVDPQVPDRNLFPEILAAIDATSEPTGTTTRRAGSGTWTELAPGIAFQVLFDDPVSRRRSMLIRAAPGSRLAAHDHPSGHEECLVLEGDLASGDCVLHAGDFHVARAGSAHPTAMTRTGCLVHVSTAL